MVAQLVGALCYKLEGCGFDSQWHQWNFSLTWSFWSHYASAVASDSNRSEYQEYFLGGKVASTEAWQPYHLRVLYIWKSWSLNLLEPSGISLPLPVTALASCRNCCDSYVENLRVCPLFLVLIDVFVKVINVCDNYLDIAYWTPLTCCMSIYNALSTAY